MKKVFMIQPKSENKRITLGMEHVVKSLIKAGYEIEAVSEEEAIENNRRYDGYKIFVGDRTRSEYIQSLEDDGLLLYHTKAPREEGFYIATLTGRFMVISGGSPTGALYGCLELSERIDRDGTLPREIYFGDAPKLKLRGPAVGLQLTHIEPPRKTYEYPITPGRFPWFYDKSLWQDFLDMMLKERCNVLYIWSGHPFSSLVKVADYPEALEVTEEEYLLNREVFGWLAEECDRRGIWLVLKFYNIHIPYPFAIKHDLELLQRSIDPLVADYTKKSIVEFIKSFPNIGLMVCLGEAIRGTQNKTRWFLETILPAVNQGIKEAEIEDIPPLILRGHDCDAKGIMNVATKQYSNLYTMWKYNGEGLTTFLPTGEWQETHQELSSHGQTHILNVHILADLEPFRYGAPSFIQKCMQAGVNRLGGNGLHLYPLFFWDWPYSPDKAEPRLKAVDRDWLWYATWFRYAWNPDRDPLQEREYWTGRMQEHFGCERKGAILILDAIENSGECAPRILRRVGITEGNRQTMSLGMTMPQFTHVKKFRPNLELWKSVSTPGEQPDEYVEKEISGEKHYGETPADMITEVRYYADLAWEQINAAKQYVTENIREYEYFTTDIQAIRLMTHSYAKKLEAAVKILWYKKTMDEDLRGDIMLLQDAKALMEESLNYYRDLTVLTKDTYLYANSMQTPQRKIPFPDGNAFGHWTQCLPKYEEEYKNFAKHVDQMATGIFPHEEDDDLEAIETLPQIQFEILTEGYQKFEVKKGNSVFSDQDCVIQNCAPELNGLTGVTINKEEAAKNGAEIKLRFEEDCQLLIGYFKVKGIENTEWMRVPELETDTHADDRGGLSVVFEEAVKVDNCPVVNVHAFQYEKGKHKIFLGTGVFTILGAVPAGTKLNSRHAGLAGDTVEMLNWMFLE